MKTDKNELDEMQKSLRDKIGNQSFMLLFYLLLLDIGLYGFGIRWLAYPVDVMVIMVVCMSIYLIRVIVNNSYLPPQTQKSKPILRLVLTVIFAVILAISIAMFCGKTTIAAENGNSAMILFVVSLVGLVIALIVTIIKRNNNK